MSEITAHQASGFERVHEPIDLKRDTRRRLREEAAFRHMSPGRLAERLLDIIVEDDLFAAVLDR